MRRQLAAGLLVATCVGAFAQDALTQGLVRRVDKSAGKVTLKHDEIRNLDMPPMTMVFGVRDRALLDQVKAGDRIRFAAGKDAAGQYVLTRIEAAK
jgi:Cu(I)/Ag(I) efflux system protein CusF